MTRNPNTPPSSSMVSPVPPSVVPLSALCTGERGVVVELAGGRGLLGRMTALGFTPGVEVTVLQNFGRGPL
ncbi:MAG TPA: ferrous iron transport protein A, partial [Chloroflexi bacterium]|nr:ferrous iron transport protein A [Chloroflexota bacterium]